MIPLTTCFQHSQVGQGVLQKNLGLDLQGVWLVLSKGRAELVRLTVERADLAGVVQRSQLVYMLLHDCLPEAESAFQGLFLEVYYVCLVLNSNSLMKI